MAEPKLPPLPPIDPEERIVTMPERFYGATLAYTPGREAAAPSAAMASAPGLPGGAHTSRPPLWLFVLVGLALLGAIGFAIWWFALRAPAAPAPVANVNRAPVVNRNANAPVITNRNANVNAPVATTTPAAATSTPAATTTPPVANANINRPPAPSGPVRLAPDSDVDGLTDAEESQIYRSDAGKPDTDGDGHLDGVEVANLYNPTTLVPNLLKDTAYVAAGSETEAGFSLLFPAGWRHDVIDPTTNAVAWLAPSGEFVQAQIADNADDRPLADWYLAQAPGVQRSQIASFKTRSGLDGIRSPDGFTSYIALRPRVVLIISYSLSGRSEAAFRRTYEMMTASVAALAPLPPSSGGSAGGTATSSATSTP